jgi:hypothetical protein
MIVDALNIILFGLASIFPVSFLMYGISERMIARHESRVGKQVGWLGYLWQTWVDVRAGFGKRGLRGESWIIAFELALVFFIGIRVEYLIFIHLAWIGFLMVWLAQGAQRVIQRIESDGLQVRYAIAGAMALLCLVACFTYSKSTDVSAVRWHPLLLVFVVPFQLCGMILFGEQPFRGLIDRSGWLYSARFYVWSLLTAKLFLGGGEWFVDIQAKAAALYLGARIFGIYFPGFRQKDLLRISIIYLFPITGALWLAAMICFALIGGGISGVS